MTEMKQLDDVSAVGGTFSRGAHADASMPPVPAIGAPCRRPVLGHFFGQHTTETGVAQIHTDAAGRRNTLPTATEAASCCNDLHPALQRARQTKVHGSATGTDWRRHAGVLDSNESGGLPDQLVETRCKTATNNSRTSALTDFLIDHHLAWMVSGPLAGLWQQNSEDRSVLMARADLFLARREWAALMKSLVPTHWGDMDYFRCGLLARAYRELRRSSESDAAWHAATRAASGQPQFLARLARMAGDWGWQREHDEALWSIVRRFPKETWAIESLRKSYGERLDTAGLHSVYAWLASLNPEDVAAKNNLAATALLLDKRTDVLHALAWEVYVTGPNIPTYATTYAWSLHLQGKTFEGLMVLKDLPAYQLEKPKVALYYGALLAAAGFKELAPGYLGFAARGSLLREERAILDQANAGLAPATQAAA